MFSNFFDFISVDVRQTFYFYKVVPFYKSGTTLLSHIDAYEVKKFREHDFTFRGVELGQKILNKAKMAKM